MFSDKLQIHLCQYIARSLVLIQKSLTYLRSAKSTFIFRTLIDWGTTVDRKYLCFLKYLKIDFSY